MKILILTLVIFISFPSMAAIEYPHANFLKNCLKGYKESLQELKDKKIDPLAPRDTTASQLCYSIFYNETEFKHFPWVIDAISFLKVPKDDIKLAEFTTPEGNCELGSYFAQKMFRTERSVGETVKFAKKICSKH